MTYFESRKNRYSEGAIVKQSVGVIGLGRMGGGVAQSLAQKGFSVYGYDPYQPKELPGVTKVADMAELL